jgi:hypothetical protein
MGLQAYKLFALVSNKDKDLVYKKDGGGLREPKIACEIPMTLIENPSTSYFNYEGHYAQSKFQFRSVQQKTRMEL